MIRLQKSFDSSLYYVYDEKGVYIGRVMYEDKKWLFLEPTQDINNCKQPTISQRFEAVLFAMKLS
jgi:hypothetical protein